MNKNVSLENAQDLLLAAAFPVEIYHVPLHYSFGRILGRNIIARQCIPHFAKSAMDGYAVRAADTRPAKSHQPGIFQVIEEIRAGIPSRETVIQGTAIKVMTGAPIPPGADTVVKWEEVHRLGDTISIYRSLPRGDNVVPVGEDVKEGDRIAARGAVITPAMTAVFAGLGINRVPVYRKVKIAIASTGDELVDPSRELQSGKIYNASLYGLAARCREMGANPVDMGIAPDEVEATANLINQGLESADMVITTGGVSTGDYDVVKDSILRVGAQILFAGVAIKPGSPMVAAIKDGKFIIALSGNPAAAMVTFDLIVVPLIKKLMGMKETHPPVLRGIMVDSFPKASPGRRFLRARLLRQDGQDLVQLTGEQANGVLKSMIDCNLLVDVPAGSGPVTAGQSVSGFLVGQIDQVNREEIIVGAMGSLTAQAIGM